MSSAPGRQPEKDGLDLHDSELTIEKRWLILARLDPEDFRRFYAKYCDGVYRFCLRRTLDPQVAEDLTSETFLRAQRNLWRFRWQGVTFGAYLYRIALNLVRQHVAMAARSVNLDEPDLTIVDARINPLAEIVLTERQMAVRTAVASLDALSREIFLLHYWEEMTTVEIAAVLGTPEGTVKTRLRRGREALRQQLRRRGIDPAVAPGDKPGDRPCERPREEAE
jgi:RNA polymerase sigma-70 factor (ECF subfamily)